MDNGYCIYFGEKAYYITSHMNEKLYALTTWGGTILVNQPNAGAIISTIHDIDKTDAEAAIILTNKLDYYWNLFCDQFTPIIAAGGVVENENGEWLFIYRRGKWDLPKGKQDDGEDLPTCAQREVKEETGVGQLSISGDLGKTWHAYHEKGRFYLKETQWYSMKTAGDNTLKPQVEEDITEIKWLKPDNLNEILENTYPSIKQVLKKCLKKA